MVTIVAQGDQYLKKIIAWHFNEIRLPTTAVGYPIAIVLQQTKLQEWELAKYPPSQTIPIKRSTQSQKIPLPTILKHIKKIITVLHNAALSLLYELHKYTNKVTWYNTFFL